MPAPTPIPIYVSPYQGGPGGTGHNTEVGFTLTNTGATGAAIVATSEMSFVNDGYTTLFVNASGVGASGPVVVTIEAQPDNAGRDINVVKIVAAASVVGIGPFRPIWWNYGGVVYVSVAPVAAGATGAAALAATKISAVRSLF